MCSKCLSFIHSFLDDSRLWLNWILEQTFFDNTGRHLNQYHHCWLLASPIVLAFWWHKSYHVSSSLTVTAAIWDQLHWLPLQQRVQDKECVLVCISACMRQHQYTLLTSTHRCLHPSIKVLSVLQYMVISQYLVPGCWDTVREASLFQVQLWNTLQPTVYDPSLTLAHFCTLLKTVFLDAKHQ